MAPSVTNNNGNNNNNNNNRNNATRSPFFQPSTPKDVITSTPGGTVHKKPAIQEHKSSVYGASANLINAIVGSGIVGIPFAMQQAGLLSGLLLIALCAILTEKSLRLLISTAKHVQVPTYETLVEACFGSAGFFFVSANMFLMAYGAMVSYLMIIKDTLPVVFGFQTLEDRRAFLILVSLLVMFPLSSQRDMADLAKTSRLSVLFDIFMVFMVILASPWYETLQATPHLLRTLFLTPSDMIHMETVFVGLGVLSFAFVCQHSAFIIAGSLEKPSQWGNSTKLALSVCGFLATICGLAGYLGFLEETQGNILNNLVSSSSGSGATTAAHWQATCARALLGTTMLFVYPMESFVARHVCVVWLFRGRAAHEGEDALVLNRRDRRITLTFLLYIMALVPSILFEDLGSVLALTGAVGGSCLSYIGPGMAYLGVYGSEFLTLLQEQYGYYWKHHLAPYQQNISTQLVVVVIPNDDTDEHIPVRGDIGYICQGISTVVWYALGMPIWCFIAQHGCRTLQIHTQEMATKSPHPLRIGRSARGTGGQRFSSASNKSRIQQLAAARRALQVSNKESNDDEDDDMNGTTNQGHSQNRQYTTSTKSKSSSKATEEAPLVKGDSLHLIGHRTVLPPTATLSYQKQGNSGGTSGQYHAVAPMSLTTSTSATSLDRQGIRNKSATAAGGGPDKIVVHDNDVDELDIPEPDLPPRLVDFVIAVGYILFGVLALAAGVFSILAKSST